MPSTIGPKPLKNDGIFKSTLNKSSTDLLLRQSTSIVLLALLAAADADVDPDGVELPTAIVKLTLFLDGLSSVLLSISFDFIDADDDDDKERCADKLFDVSEVGQPSRRPRRRAAVVASRASAHGLSALPDMSTSRANRPRAMGESASR